MKWEAGEGRGGGGGKREKGWRQLYYKGRAY